MKQTIAGKEYDTNNSQIVAGRSNVSGEGPSTNIYVDEHQGGHYCHQSDIMDGKWVERIASAEIVEETDEYVIASIDGMLPEKFVKTEERVPMMGFMDGKGYEDGVRVKNN